MNYEEFPETDLNMFIDYFIEMIENTLKGMVYSVPDIGPDVFAFAAVGDGNYDIIRLEFDRFPDKDPERESLFINMGQEAYTLKPGKIVGVYLVIGGFMADDTKGKRSAKEVLTITGSSFDGKKNHACSDVDRVDGSIKTLTNWKHFPYPQEKTIKSALLDKFWSGYRLAMSKKDAKSIYGIMRGFESDN